MRDDLSAPVPQLPGRKALCDAMAPYLAKNTGVALGWVFADFTLLGLCAWAVAGSTPWWAKVAAGLLMGLFIARLFIIGHDACHQSLTDHRVLNRILGRLVFLPSLTPYSLWEVGHNVSHHGFSNLKGRDYVWAPFSPAEFAALPVWRQRLERAYRSGWGVGLYYLIELWWKKLYFPSASEVGARRPVFAHDSWLVTLAAAAWLAALTWAAWYTAQAVWLLLLTGFALPLAVWNTLMGFVIYVHHTDPEVHWYTRSDEWAKSAPYLSATVHYRIPVLGSLLHHIMEHPAHHLHMGIPFYRLKAAQRELERLAPGHVVQRKWSWRGYRACVVDCKVYDHQYKRWLAFSSALGASA